MSELEHQGVSVGRFTLTDEQRRFKAMLAAYLRNMLYWGFEVCECEVERLRTDMSVLSHGSR